MKMFYTEISGIKHKFYFVSFHKLRTTVFVL